MARNRTVYRRHAISIFAGEIKLFRISCVILKLKHNKPYTPFFHSRLICFKHSLVTLLRFHNNVCNPLMYTGETSRGKSFKRITTAVFCLFSPRTPAYTFRHLVRCAFFLFLSFLQISNASSSDGGNYALV